jgi:hypothetical protein
MVKVLVVRTLGMALSCTVTDSCQRKNYENENGDGEDDENGDNQ